MRIRLWMTFGLVVALGSLATARQSPIGSFPPPPADLAALWRTSDVVAYVSVESTKQRAARLEKQASATAVQEHSLKVIELFKGTITPLTPLRMTQEGGSVVVAGREVRTGFQMKIISEGSEAVVFLQLWKADGTYVLSFGPPGLFEFDPARNEFVVPESIRSIAVFNAQPSMPKDALLEKLRAMKKGVGSITQR